MNTRYLILIINQLNKLLFLNIGHVNNIHISSNFPIKIYQQLIVQRAFTQ